MLQSGHPRFWTPRTAERLSLGPQIAAMAEALGTPLMPWQRLVADVGGELDPATGRPAYREVIVAVPRQNGKTTLVLAWEVQRAIGWGEPQRICYSAQSGKDAAEKLIEDQAPLLERRKRQLGVSKIRRANGHEAVEFVNGSRIFVIGSTADSGHGKTIDLAVKDELFADSDNRRDQALVPAMATRAAAQILTISTMGTDESFPWNEAVERGRRAVAEDVRSGVAYFEWSAAADLDPDDPATWRACMPALGHTITEDVVRHARRTLSDGEFRRAFLNQQTRADDRVIPLEKWDKAVSEKAAPTGPLVFAVDVNPDRTAGAIATASKTAAELVDYRPGTGWIVSRATELTARHGGVWVVDGVGPAGSLISDLEKAGLKVHSLQARDMAKACGQFFDGVMDGAYVIRQHHKLDDAAAAAVKRPMGDAWAWARKSSASDVCPLVAVTLALHGAREFGQERPPLVVL